MTEVGDDRDAELAEPRIGASALDQSNRSGAG